VVCTVPSLGHCPQGLVAERTRWHQLSQQFNQQLIDAIRAITNRHRATIALAPMAAYVDQVMADPAACGFAHTGEGYLLAKEPSAPVEQYVFWDDEHFTTAVHTHLAAQFVTTVQTNHGSSMQG